MHDFRPNCIPLSLVRSIIVSITKFSIVIGSPYAYFQRRRCAITCTWVSNHRYPITTYCNWISTRFPRQSRALYSFFRLTESATGSFAHTKFSEDFVSISKFVIDTINKLLDIVSYNSASNSARNFKSVSRDYPLNCTPLDPVTITKEPLASLKRAQDS